MRSAELLLWVAAVGCATEPRGVEPAPSVDSTETADTAPDVLVIVVDTLRADAVERAETPKLDALASEGQRVSWAWSPSSWTAPSTLSVMTGAHVREHGWDLPFPRFMRADGLSYPAVDDLPTLAEVMRAHGYATVGLYANPLLSRELGWQRGFDIWAEAPDVVAARRLTKKLEGLESEPVLAYVHLLGPHQPLKPSRRPRERWAVRPELLKLSDRGLRIEHVEHGSDLRKDQYWRAYHAEVEDADQRVGSLVRKMRQRGSDRPLLVIVTSDHGELLGEHDAWGHESDLWHVLTHVPLVVEGPAPELPDVLSTAAIPDIVTRSAGIDVAWPVSLDDRLPVVSQRDGGLALSLNGHTRGIWSPEDDVLEGVFDASVDIEETRPGGTLADRASLTMWRRHWEVETPHRSREPVKEGIDAETRRLLEELGYMGGE